MRVPVLLLAATAAAIVLIGCGSGPERVPTATPDISATVTAAVAQALGTPVTRPVEVRPGYCGRLCDGDDYWRTASLSDVKAELDSGADVNATDRLGLTSLHYAATYGYTDIVSLLLEAGADANALADGWLSPLESAIVATRPDPEIVALLLEHGADANAVSPEGFTPLHWALIFDEPASYDIVKILLDNGADVKAKDEHGSTPLHYASQSGDHNLITLLLDRGADIEAEAHGGDTSLHFAAVSDQTANVKMLLSQGANMNARGSKGRTPCEVAVEHHTICSTYFRNSDYDPTTAPPICTAADATDQVQRAQKEIIALLCGRSDIEATIEAILKQRSR